MPFGGFSNTSLYVPAIYCRARGLSRNDDTRTETCNGHRFSRRATQNPWYYRYEEHIRAGAMRRRRVIKGA